MTTCPACKKSTSRCDCFTPQFRYIPEYRQKVESSRTWDRKKKKTDYEIHRLKKHGLHGYFKYRCKCDICMSAAVSYRRERYIVQKEKKKNHDYRS